MKEIEALERLLEKRLSSEEVAALRESIERKIPRFILAQRFDRAVADRRKANPAAVSPRWGLA